MVTTPASPPSQGGASPQRREMAESFGDDAARYDRTRPHYPDMFIDEIARRLPGRAILDVGIGTGISSRPFSDRGFTVLGVEADPRMAEFARLQGFDVEVARFEDWDAAGRMFDGLISGQAWHWVDPVAGAARAADVLRPGGFLVLFWNEARPPAELAAQFGKVFASLETGLPFNPWATALRRGAYNGIIDAAEAGIQATNAFHPFESVAVDWEATISRDAWLEQTSTSGGINRLPQEKLEALLAGLGATIDAIGGEFVLAYTTVGGIAERRG
ncbi:bifunctional 2-polyprenyl-6-hydroxyphenol methylase/3-demethylubiquinol 3-O-methyltransferase UbiG [Arthrobacter sp. GMC3]|uniref:class I SAM-dependent methyltransferase n=1 Tax=Arthrobacter sp. GMC3 TaxID=2058894 RepID=UPI000CE519A2|nr:class I SAM-dependent methyltransferase [Arthrobacter sp. GMC3]